MSEETRGYRIQHRTIYAYSGRVDLCHSLAHLSPREDEGQLTESHEIVVTPSPDFESERLDYFGNKVRYFSIQRSHKSLEIASDLTIRIPSAAKELPESGKAADELILHEIDIDASGVCLGNYFLPTSACPFLDSIRRYLKPSLRFRAEVMNVANDLMNRVHADFEYMPGATHTNTPLSEVMQLKKGVCQDFAHVMIAALRSAGIPTRYVSGYLETLPPPGQEKLRGADASHAWIEVWAPTCGWVGFDPTNNQIPGDQHIKLCHGRDYFDVQPMRGMFLGSGSQTLRVEVDVERIQLATAASNP